MHASQEFNTHKDRESAYQYYQLHVISNHMSQHIFLDFDISLDF